MRRGQCARRDRECAVDAVGPAVRADHVPVSTFAGGTDHRAPLRRDAAPQCSGGASAPLLCDVRRICRPLMAAHSWLDQDPDRISGAVLQVGDTVVNLFERDDLADRAGQVESAA